MIQNEREMGPEYGADEETVSARLVRTINERPVTPEDLGQAAFFTLDAVASIVGGRNTEPGRILREWLRAIEPGKNDPGRAALLAGSLCHILEIDDLHRESVVHPGCVVVPAVLALSDVGSSGPDGRKCLTAVLHGFEAACRVGAAVGRDHYKVWHNTATCGPFGSAMAASTLLELPWDRTVHALGNAGTQAAGLWQFLDSGAMSKHLHAGRAAEAGVVAATLASKGFTGAPEIFEGAKGFFRAMCPDGDPKAVVRDIAGSWKLRQTSIKPWPSCRHTHPAIDAATEIRKSMLATGLDGSEIASVSVATYQAALDLCDRPHPASEYDAKFSLQHTVAAALADDQVWFDSFGAGARERLSDLRQRVAVAIDAECETSYPARWGARVVVESVGGERFAAERDGALGDPELPLSQDRLVDKARRLLAFGGAHDPDGIIDSILAMAEGGAAPSLRELVSGEGAARHAAE